MAERLVAYWWLLAAQVRSQTQYRASFTMDLFSSAGFAALDVLSILVFFRVTPALGGLPSRGGVSHGGHGDAGLLHR